MAASPEGVAAPTRKLSCFSLGDYVGLVEALQARGYADVGLDGLVPERRVMFLRHDVDLSLARAVRVAEAERSLGVRATYYLLISTELYSIASADGRRLTRRLVELGHALGLHFDATRYEGGRDALEAAAREECDMLERLAGAPVRTISFHRPAPELIGLAGTFAGRRHTYEPCFFHDLAYVSDSSGGFFRGHPLDHPAVAAGQAVQLLTHPIWWASDKPLSAAEAVAELRREKRLHLDEALANATAKAPVGARRDED
ncbi:MAG TPA: hypothetical protein VHM92_06250 [Allosphingosinicella sp.]|nr:hypothetical protein [Allosphingosinicella sp.]